MSLHGRVLKGAALLSAGQALGQVLSFARNVILARLLSPADIGLGASFWITVSLLQMISDLAADKLLIQARDGDDESLQRTAHAWQVLRGLGAGALLLLLAGPVSVLFHAPQARWAFQCTALIPVLRGLAHLDIRRLQRHLRFGPQVGVQLGSQAIATLLAAPLAWWLRDFSAVLWVVLIQEGANLAGSHLWAHRSYRLGWNRAHAARLFAFGWPLLINGLLMFGTVQGDRLFVGAGYSLTDLGLYSVAFLLTMVPADLLMGVSSSVLLPLLAEVQDQPVCLRHRYVLASAVSALAAGWLGPPFILLGGDVIGLVYGAAYHGAGVFVGLLAAMQAFRVLRTAPMAIAIATADTRTPMVSNVCRATALIGAGAAVALQASLPWVALSGLGGEVFAWIVVLIRLRGRDYFGWRASLLPAIIVALSCAAAFLARQLTVGRLPLAVMAALLLFALVPLALAALSREFRRHAEQLMGRYCPMRPTGGVSARPVIEAVEEFR